MWWGFWGRTPSNIEVVPLITGVIGIGIILFFTAFVRRNYFVVSHCEDNVMALRGCCPAFLAQTQAEILEKTIAANPG
jgi:hypothetical protein